MSGGLKPGNDQKRGNQTIVNRAACHKQKTDNNGHHGGMIERRPNPDIA